MKLSIPLLLLLSCCAAEMPLFAQDTVYYDIGWKKTDPANAYYLQVRTKSSVGWNVTDYLHSGKIKLTGAYSDDSMHIRQGEFVTYDSTGYVSNRRIFVNNKLEGPETFYYPNGQVMMTGNNKNDTTDGEWMGYYASGKSSGKATYKDGKQVGIALLNEDGSPKKDISIFRREADFPGGPSQWLKFISSSSKYPDQAVMHDIKGTVYITFKVTKEGKVADVHVDIPVNKYLDKEAMRVIKSSPEWQPAIYGGIVSDSYKRQPIIFTF